MTDTNTTVLRGALKENSELRKEVKDGMGAVQRSHRDYFDPAIRQAFADSLELDEAVKAGHEQENRWDYLLGHQTSGQLIGIEPHSAKNDEITTVIKKRRAAREQLKDHLREGVKIAKWLWVASGRVHFAPLEKAMFRLSQNGIEFVGTRVAAKHLPKP